MSPRRVYDISFLLFFPALEVRPLDEEEVARFDFTQCKLPRQRREEVGLVPGPDIKSEVGSQLPQRLPEQCAAVEVLLACGGARETS